MTTPSGSILFNNASGSDTAASGLGPSTAVTGTGASTNNTTTVDLSADTPDLSGVSAGDLLYVDSTAGPQFSIIASVDDGADTVTCDLTFTQTESGRNWAIGGKRKTFGGSSNLFVWYQTGYVIELEDNQTTTAQLDVGSTTNTTGNLEIKSDTPGTKRTITINHTGNGFNLSDDTTWRDLTIVYDASLTPVNSNQSIFARRAENLWAYDCDLGNSTTYSISYRVTGIQNTWMHGCNITSDAAGVAANGDGVFTNCKFYDMDTSHALTCGRADYALLVANCVFKDISATGVLVQDVNDSVLIYNCIFDNCTTGASCGGNSACIYNCIFVDCTNALINDNGNLTSVIGNAYYNNTNDWVTAEPNIEYGKISLTADPFTDSANDDYTLNDTAGGGADCKDASYPTTDIFGNASNFNTGLYQDSSTGGSGGFRRISPDGGMSG